MEKLSKAAKLGRKFKRLETVMLIVIPSYFIGRVLMSLIFNI